LPLQFWALDEALCEEHKTFRQITTHFARSPSARPEKAVAIYDSNRKAAEIPEDDLDRSLTIWLMGEFLQHLDAAPSDPAIDYLKETFSQLLELPAWTVRGPNSDEPPDCGLDERGQLRGYILTGRHVPLEYLKNLTEAADTLFAPLSPQRDIKCKGDIWVMHFDGEEGSFPAKGNQFVGWLHKLLVHPRRSFTTSDLRRDPDRLIAVDSLLGAGHLNDRPAVRDIWNRIEDIREIAKTMGELTTEQEAELERLQKEVETHPSKKQFESTARAAYHNITTQKRTFLKKLKGSMPKLHAHLTAYLDQCPTTLSLSYAPPYGDPTWND
jgi:hypothetical protein